MHRLEHDRSLARFAGQFVPLKIVTDGNPQWSKWARKYPIDARGIPRLYVVRADGELLFGAVGSLPGDKLPQMMLASLSQAGRMFSEAESQLLEQAVTKSQTALDNGELLTASFALSETLKLGSPDQLQSFARPALMASELYETLQAELDSKTQKTTEELSDNDNQEPVDLLLALLEVGAAYRLFPDLKSKATRITRDLKKNKTYAQTLPQAELLLKARVLKASSLRLARSRAPAAYANVIRRYPGSRVAELARAELAQINPDAKALNSAEEHSKPSSEFRKWSARSGNFTTNAKYLQQQSGKVQLRKEDGKVIVVDISILSDVDQAFLKDR